MTFFGELNPTLVVFSLVYWCIRKEWVISLMMGWSAAVWACLQIPFV